MEVLAVAGLICAAGYYVSLRLWPYAPCKRCRGSSRNAGSSRKRFGTCRKCGGSGRRRRIGARRD